MSRGKKKPRQIKPGQNIHIDRIRALYPDDSDVFWDGGQIIITPKEENKND